MVNPDVVFRREGALGRMTLNRPKALNALTQGMVAAMLGQLRDWAGDPSIRAVLLDAIPGRAFCAGGDIRAILESAKRRDGSAADFFRTEYRLNATIERFPKPYIALIDGFAFGGALGISVHGSYRAVSENAVMSMPETLIGFFPDIGASRFLNRCPGEMGMYLALSGARLKGGDLLYTGLATHFVPAARIGDIAPRLAEGETAGKVLSDLSADPGPAPLSGHRAIIDRAFAAPSVEAVLDRLAASGDWGSGIAAQISALSPTGLKITFRLMREAKSLDLESCLRMEFRLAVRAAECHDFAEGVRAAVIDKDQKPRWKPSRLEQIADEEVASYFRPLGPAELTF
jgi:enoyl-CoA hydratase/carnithine racemase